MNHLKRKVWHPLLALLREGLTPTGLAWSVSAGLALGIFPMLGATTTLCLLVGLAFRLNQPAMQLVNYLAYPLQLLLLVPFIRMGEWLFGGQPMPLSISEILTSLKADLPGTIAAYWTRIWHACVAWSLVSLPLMVLLAVLLRLVFLAAARRLKDDPA